MLSKNNIKHLLSLHRKKKREEAKEFLVEGEKMVLEALSLEDESIVAIYCLDSFIEQYQISSRKVVRINERELKQISSLMTPNQAIAQMKITPNIIEERPFYLAIDGVQDPGNFGTIMRLADWFGLTQIMCSEDCVDVYNSKVVQASMGAIFRVNVHYVDLKDFFSRTQLPVFGALLNGNNIYRSKLKKHGILLMGNEGNGIRPDLLPLITEPLTIPKFGNSESLNVSVATGIILSEFFREEDNC